MQFKYTENSGQQAYILVDGEFAKYSRNINSKIYTIEQEVVGISLADFMAKMVTISKLDNDTFKLFDTISREAKLDT